MFAESRVMYTDTSRARKSMVRNYYMYVYPWLYYHQSRLTEVASQRTLTRHQYRPLGVAPHLRIIWYS